MAQEFYLQAGDKMRGPYSPNQIRAMAGSGELLPEALLTLDRKSWFKASALKGVVFAATPVEDPEPDDHDPSTMGRFQQAVGGLLGRFSRGQAKANAADEPEEDDESAEDQARSALVARFTNEDQDPAIVRKMLSRIEEILMSGEEIRYVAIQKKPVISIAPDCVVLTNKRFIFYVSKLLGQMNFEDYPWRTLSNATLSEGLLGATFSISTSDGRVLSMDYLPKAQARQVYRFAQEMEESAFEARRQRDLEARRASAGGVVIQGLPVQAASSVAPTPVAEDPVEKLKKLKALLDAGLISPGEYDAKKAEILARM